MSASFLGLVHKQSLIDLGFIGPRFTWSHGTSITNWRSARLDRSLCDGEWRHFFTDAGVKHLAHSYSDHCLLLLQTTGSSSAQMGRRPFRFLEAWFLDKRFMKFIEESWNPNANLGDAMSVFIEKVMLWEKFILATYIACRKNIVEEDWHEFKGLWKIIPIWV